MGLTDYLKYFPKGIYPYFMLRILLLGMRASATIGYHSLKQRKLPFNVKMLQPPERNLFKLWLEGRTPEYQFAMGNTLSITVDYYIEAFSRIAREPNKVIWHEDTVTPEIIHALGLIPFMVEGPAGLFALTNPQLLCDYIDIAENAGFPNDICTMPRATLGMVMEDMLPSPQAIITANSPCDGGMHSYLPIEQKMKVPMFRLDVPWDIYDHKAREYYSSEMWRMVHFLEEVTGHRLDIDRLREICDLRNKMHEATLGIFDLMKVKPCPIGGILIPLSNMAYQCCPGTLMGVDIMEKVLAVAQSNYMAGKGLIKNERYRAIMWGISSAVPVDLFKWMEDEFGLVVVMEMLTYNRLPYIDTKNEKTMVNDLAGIIAAAPMARHTRGPVENFFEDLFHLHEAYQADLIIMSAHHLCKSTRAVLGLLRDQCRTRGIPLMIIDCDIFDHRVYSQEDIEQQITNFMENVMR